MKNFKWRWKPIVEMALLLLLIASCAVGPDYKTPTIVMPNSFSEESAANDLATAELASWWKSFNDPLLDVLIHEAIQQNFDYQIALEKIIETRALYHLQTAELFPKIDLNAQQRRSRISQTMFESPFLGPSTQDFYRLGFDASWEIDLFGKRRRAKEAAFYDYEARVETARDVYITLLSEIATEYIQIRSLQQQIALTKKTIFVQSDIFQLTTSLFTAGLSSDIEVSNAEQLLKQEQAKLFPLKEDLKQGIYRLAVLLGKEPESLTAEFADRQAIPTSVKEIPLGLPSELLRRRPDIRSAERTLAMETANVGVAVAELFPTFSILGSYGYQTTQNGKWLKPSSRNWRFGPNLDWPILYFGRLRANIHATTSQQQQALLNYEQTILEALEDVESSLVAYRQEENRLRAIEQELLAVERRYTLERDRYLSGLIDFSTLLAADQERLQVEIQRAVSTQTLSTNLVALYKSLGGDWPSSCSH
ncbi:MAG: efflux transporter outer membrane subunit [Chlamydiota bacterium]